MVRVKTDFPTQNHEGGDSKQDSVDNPKTERKEVVNDEKRDSTKHRTQQEEHDSRAAERDEFCCTKKNNKKREEVDSTKMAEFNVKKTAEQKNFQIWITL